jgi:hypothetical protein
MFFRSRLQAYRAAFVPVRHREAATIMEASGLFVLGVDNQDASGKSGLQRAAHGIQQQRLAKTFVPMLKIDGQPADERGRNLGVARQLFGKHFGKAVKDIVYKIHLSPLSVDPDGDLPVQPSEIAVELVWAMGRLLPRSTATYFAARA